MLKVSDAFNSAFAAPDRELRARVTIGKTVYDSDDLTSINYDSGAMTGEQFSIGSTYMNSAKIIFSHLVEGLKQLDEVLVELGVLKPDGTVEYVKMGTFIVDDKIQMDRNNNTTTIECMDRMTMLGGTYVSKLTYPARIKDVAIEIANMAGVKANETSFARLSENKINQPTGYTYRDAIGLIAQFQMGFALFDRDGLLDIRTLQDNSFKIDPNQYFLKGLVKNETFFKLNGISCTVVTTSKDENGNETSKTTVLQSGSSSGAQIKLANNVMTQDVLDRMYESLKFTNYYPFTLNWNGNPAVEAGDWLTLEDMQGNEFKVPNMSYTLTFNGGLTASSKAETSTNSSVTYSYGGSMSNIVNEIGGREGAEGNHIYEGTEDQEPTLSKEGDLWYKHVGPDTEEWIYKDGKWEFLTSTKTANDAADAADKASKEAEEAKKTANESVAAADDAVGKANQAVEDAGFANSTASDAKTAAANAQKDATGALSDAQNALTNSSSAMADSTQARKDSAAAAADATTAKGQAANALTDAKKALTDSGSAMADSAQARKDSATAKIQAANAATQANQAVVDASTAKADAAAAKGQATNALGQANTAIGNALTALNKVNDMSIGGRNYLLNSNQYLTGAGKRQKHVADISGDTLQKLRGKQVTISVDVDYTTARHETGQECRIGTEFAVTYASGTRQYLGAWKKTTAGESFSGRISQTISFKDEPIISTSAEVWVYAQDNFDSSSVGRPKLEIGNVATDWSPAPEDVQQQFTDINGELSQKVSQTTYNTLAGTVDTVSTLAKQNQSTIGTLATKTSVDTVNKTATTAQTLAQQNANELLNKASTNTVDTLTQRVTTAESTLSQTATKAELALTKTDVDKLNDTVKSQGVTLDATATKAELQVAQTNVDNLKKTVTSNSAGVTANANALKLKADSSTVSDLDGRVTSLSGQLDVQSDLISAKVTASDVTGMLNGYATQSWSQGQISAAKNEISASVETVKQTVDNTQVGGRNYILNSDRELNGGGTSPQMILFTPSSDLDAAISGKFITISFDIDIKNAVSGSVRNRAGVSSVFKRKDGSSFYIESWYDPATYGGTYKSRVYHTLYVPNDAVGKVESIGLYSQIQADSLILNRPKISISTVKDDWTPAPEDQATVDWTKSQLDVTDKKITAGITTVTNTLNNNIASATAGMATTTWTNSQITAAKQAISLDVEKSITTATAGMATQTWTKGQIKMTADNINLSVSKVQNNLDNLAIGGRNYILKSGTYTANMNTMTRMYLAESIGYFSEKSIALSCRIDFDNHVLGQNNRYGMETSFQGADGKTYYAGVWKTASAGESFHGTIHALFNMPKLSLTNDLREFYLYNQSATPNSTVTKPKIEIGTRATDWTEAPEDNATVESVSKIEVDLSGVKTTVANKADQSQITQLSNQIGLKADTTALNELKGTVDKQGSEITLNTNSIKLKADQSSVDTLKGTVDKQGSAIDVNTKAIALKASQSIVDTLTGRVSTAEGKITVQADQIAQTVSKTELTTKLNGYATQTWTQSQIKSTADSINLSVTKVDSKVDNLNTSDRNLLIKSGTFETGLASDVTVSNNTYGGNRILMIPKSPADNTTHDPYVPIPSVDMVGTEYVLSFYLKADVNGDKFAVNLFSPNTVTYAINSQGIVTNTPTGGDGYSWFTATNTWVRYWVKYTQTSTNAKKKLIIGRTGTATIGKDNKGGFQLASPMLSEGNMTNKPWAAAPEDFATDIEFSELQVTVNGIQGTVQNKADKSQITQLAGQITSVVGDVSANSSQITQMKADINLRVQKSDVVNQINISPEGILIDGQKVHITGLTRIDNAVIKDAMIADIKADKITAGTLNAANVNVINLDANNITTGTIKGANLSMNLNTGEILFQKGSIRSTNGNLNINIDDGSMSLTNSQGEGAYFIDGKIAMTKNDIWTNGAIHYGQLTFGNNIFGNALGSVSGVLLEGAGGVIVGNKEFNPLTLFGPGKTYPSGGGIAANNSFATVASNGWASIEGGTSYAVPFSTNNPSIVAGISGKYSAPGAWMPTSDKGAASFVKGKLVGLYAEDGGFSNDHGTTADLAAAVDGRSGYILSAATYARTYASGAQMTITANGVFGRISSASKYKLAIGEISTLNDEAHQFLSVKPKQWFDKSESEALADTMTTGNTDYIDDAKALPHTGFIAEDLYTAGLDNYVIRGNDGSIESIQYDRLPVLHHELIRELFNRLDAAEMEIYKLKQEVINNAN